MRSQAKTTSSAVTGAPSDQSQGFSVTVKRVLPSADVMDWASERSGSARLSWPIQTSGR